MVVKAVLFDIGGVCVVSPFRAILAFERRHDIPQGYINFAISYSSSREGAWQRLEKNQIPLDDTFFILFQRDLENTFAWREFMELDAQRDSDTKLVNPQNRSTPPCIDARGLFWEMMRISRTPDPHMYPALLRLCAARRFIVGALSNTVMFPTGIKDDHGEVFENRLELRQANGPADKIEPDIRLPFVVFVSSAHVGMRKPESEIYEFAIKELSHAACEPIRAEHILFLDDIGQNLKAAKNLGMQTIKVNLDQTKEAVKQLEKMVGINLTELEHANDNSKL